MPNGEHIPATIAKDEKKRMGLDMTFNAPKSVSMQALIGNDQTILAAYSAAVCQALPFVEPLIAARRKVSGKSYRERTGNMVAGLFRHEMSWAKYPQLHTHAIVPNITQRHDGAWQVLNNDDIFQVQHQIDAIYKMFLAHELQAQGYSLSIAVPKGDFELAHISREQIKAFSQRSQVIEEALARNGKTRADASALEKQIICLATRPRKDERDRALIKHYWTEKNQSLNIDYHLQTTASYHYSSGQTPTSNQTATNPAPPHQYQQLPAINSKRCMDFIHCQNSCLICSNNNPRMNSEPSITLKCTMISLTRLTMPPTMTGPAPPNAPIYHAFLLPRSSWLHRFFPSGQTGDCREHSLC